jgi:hypothetical protein
MLGLLDAGIGGFPCPVLQLLRLHRHCCLRLSGRLRRSCCRRDHALALARQQPLRIRIALGRHGLQRAQGAALLLSTGRRSACRMLQYQAGQREARTHGTILKRPLIPLGRFMRPGHLAYHFIRNMLRHELPRIGLPWRAARSSQWNAVPGLCGSPLPPNR